MLLDLPKQLFHVIQEFGQTLHGQAKEDLSQSQLRSLLDSALRKCHLVTREEFDAQQAVLLRTREKLEQLEQAVKELTAENPTAKV
jgi:ubiquinone biosynthesis accessory factor UbiK